MNRPTIKLPEWLYILSFLLYLVGSAMALIEQGVELSLWLMTFAVLTTMITTILPWLDFRCLQLEPKGCRAGWRLALVIQFISWSSFAYGMFLRLARNLLPFYLWITLTTLLWAVWLFVFIYSRHACRPKPTGDTLDE